MSTSSNIDAIFTMLASFQFSWLTFKLAWFSTKQCEAKNIKHTKQTKAMEMMQHLLKLLHLILMFEILQLRKS